MNNQALVPPKYVFNMVGVECVQKEIVVVEASSTSFNGLMFDYLAFVIQQL
jgi:hypothetical protein